MNLLNYSRTGRPFAAIIWWLTSLLAMYSLDIIIVTMHEPNIIIADYASMVDNMVALTLILPVSVAGNFPNIVYK